MKRFLQLFLIILLAMAISVSLAACKDNEPDPEPAPKENLDIEEIVFSADSVALEVGESYDVDVTLKPKKASSSELEWSSSDESIVTVSDGKITAVGAGTATVTARSEKNADISDQIEVTVTEPIVECSHVPGDPVIKNEKNPNCKKDGGYDEIVYCTLCEEELSREHTTIPKGYHDYVNSRCTGCGEVVSAGLIYMLHGEIGSADAYYEVIHVGTCSDVDIVIPENVDGIPVKVIGDAFIGCSFVKSIRIPATVTSVDHYMNSRLGGLTEYKVDPTNPCYEAREGVLYNKTNPDEIILAAYPLARGADSFTVPTDVSRIGSHSFEGVNSLLSVVIGGKVEVIERSAFAYSSLINVEIGSSVEVIGDSAFEMCRSLLTVTLGEGLNELGSSAFAGCYKLVEVIDNSELGVTNDPSSPVYIMETVLTIHTGESIIDEVGGMLFITHESRNILLGCIKDPGIYLVLPDNYNGESYEIYNEAFNNVRRAVSVTVGSGVTYIGEGAFLNCESIVEIVNRSSLDISAGMSNNGCIATYAKVVVEESVLEDYQQFLFYTDDEGAHFLVAYTGDGIEITLPNYFYDETYVVADRAFANHRSIERLIIGDGVVGINSFAFYGCVSLSEVTIPDTVVYIGNSAFSNCAISLLNIPDSVETIGDLAFAGNNALKKIIIGSGLSSMGVEAFGSCNALATVEITVVNKTYRSINNVIYSKDMKTLILYPLGLTAESFVVPEEVEVIDIYAFAYNRYLVSLVIGDNVKTVSRNALCSMDQLTELTVGASVESIGEYAFSWIGNLNTVVWKSTVAELEDYVFSGTSGIKKIYFVGGTAEWQNQYSETFGNEILGSVEVVYNYEAE